MLSACSAKEPLVRTKIVTVPGPSKVVPIKEELTEPCVVDPIVSEGNVESGTPSVPETSMTNRDVWLLAVGALGAVEDCNTKLKLIKEQSTNATGGS